MTTVTGYTAEHMDAIINEVIASATIPTSGPTAGHLILTKHNGTTVDLGVVKGDTGTTGAVGAAGSGIPLVTSYPGSPTVGLMVYRTDLAKLMVYAGSTSGWRPAWNTPWGLVDPTSGSNPIETHPGQTGISTATTVKFATTGTPDFAFNFTPVGNRTYRVTLTGHINQQYEGGLVTVELFRDGATTNNVVNFDMFLPGRNSFTLEAVLTGLTGGTATNLTAKLTCVPGTSTGRVTTGGDLANGRWRMTVEDIGPNGAPA